MMGGVFFRILISLSSREGWFQPSLPEKGGETIRIFSKKGDGVFSHPATEFRAHGVTQIARGLGRVMHVGATWWQESPGWRSGNPRAEFPGLNFKYLSSGTGNRFLKKKEKNFKFIF
jgi:hypothetical protein